MAMSPLSPKQVAELRERGLNTDGRELIEAKARRLVQGERDQQYAPPSKNFARIAAMWSVVLGTEVNAEQVALCMAAVKLARLAHDPKSEDSKVDVIGYILCLDWIQHEQPQADPA